MKLSNVDVPGTRLAQHDVPRFGTSLWSIDFEIGSNKQNMAVFMILCVRLCSLSSRALLVGFIYAFS